MELDSLEARLKREAQRLGFALTGIAPATEADHFPEFERWLDAGFAGEMQYLHKHRTRRRHPQSVLAGVRSVLMLGLEYPDTVPAPGQLPLGKVAKYARGPDYHRFTWDRLNTLADWLQHEVPGSSAQGVADTAPLLERDFARRAGLGWVGKNTMLIHKHRGSFFFLAGLLTDIPLKPDPPHTASHCGTCTACLDACPTQAFPEPGILDARRCISYLTIEHRSAIPLDFREGIGDWIWGCDICQDVCPWNRRDRGEVTFPGQPELGTLDPIELLALSETEFRQRFRGTVFFRSHRTGLLRNAAIVLGNVGDSRAIPALKVASRDPDEVIAEAAAWALRRIQGRQLAKSHPVQVDSACSAERSP